MGSPSFGGDIGLSLYHYGRLLENPKLHPVYMGGIAVDGDKRSPGGIARRSWRPDCTGPASRPQRAEHDGGLLPQ